MDQQDLLEDLRDPQDLKVLLDQLDNKVLQDPQDRLEDHLVKLDLAEQQEQLELAVLLE